MQEWRVKARMIHMYFVHAQAVLNRHILYASRHFFFLDAVHIMVSNKPSLNADKIPECTLK